MPVDLCNAQAAGEAILEVLVQSQPQDNDLLSRAQLREKLNQQLQSALGSATDLFIFGSEVAGILRRDSDMDLCVTTGHSLEGSLSRKHQQEVLTDISKVLKRDYPHSILISHARIPILKVEGRTPPHFDICCNWPGVRNSHFLRHYVENYPTKIQPLATAVVLLAKNNGIHGAKHQGLKTYTILLMVVFYLLRFGHIHFIPIDTPLDIQCDPEPLAFEAAACDPEWLAYALAGFLETFGCPGLMQDLVVSIRQETAPTKQQKQWEAHALAVEDPFEPLINTSEHLRSEDWSRIQAVMQSALRGLQEGTPLPGLTSAQRPTQRLELRPKGSLSKRPSGYYERVAGAFGADCLRVTDVLRPTYYAPRPRGSEAATGSPKGSATSDEDSAGLTSSGSGSGSDSDDDEEDVVRWWLDPRPVGLRRVHSRFGSPELYLETVAQNIRAEYCRLFCEIRQRDCKIDDPGGFPVTIAGQDLLQLSNNSFTAEGLTKWLVAVVFTDARGTHCSLHIVWRQTPSPEDFEGMAVAPPCPQQIIPAIVAGASALVESGVELQLRPALPIEGAVDVDAWVCVLEYIGGFMLEHSAALRLLTAVRQDKPPRMLECVADPGVAEPGRYHSARHLSAGRVDYAQAKVLQQLNRNLEAVQGPPGTGKSCLITHMINFMMPDGHVLVTAQTNVAVDAVCEQLGQRDDVVVVGKYTKMAAGLEYRPDAVVERQPEMRRLRRRLQRIEGVQGALQDRITRKMRCVTGDARKRHEAIRRELQSLRKERVQLPRMRELEKDREKRLVGCYVKCLTGLVKRACQRLFDLKTWLAQQHSDTREALDEEREAAKKRVLANARVLLCTLHSIPRLQKLYASATGAELQVHTAFVDEAGCMTEAAVPLILSLRPSNVFLIGDHHQLPPFTVFRHDELKGTRHGRSLLERVANVRTALPMLTTQYRMHPDICAVVDKLFYSSRIVTAVQTRRERPEPLAMWWVEAAGEEQPLGTSMENPTEAAAVRRVCLWLLRHRPGKSVLVLTFYKAQLRALCSLLWGDEKNPQLRDVRVLTVDAAQGQQGDIVVLSCVRTGALGFSADRHRMCVALSRAKHMLVCVGTAAAFQQHSSWNEVVEASCRVPAVAGATVELSLAPPPSLRDPDAQQLWVVAHASSGKHRAVRLQAHVAQMHTADHPACSVLEKHGWSAEGLQDVEDVLGPLLTDLCEWDELRVRNQWQRAQEVASLFGDAVVAPESVVDDYDFM